MSQNPRNKPPIRKVPYAPAPPRVSPPASVSEPEVEEFDYEYEPEYSGSYDYPESYQGSKPANKPGKASKSAARGVGQRDYRAPSPPSKRDPYPYILGGVIGALVVGLMALTYLLVTGNRSAPANPSSNPANNSSSNHPVQQAGGTTVEPVRMPIAEFKALYDDPAKRPLIIDVRAADRYAEGHIEGAVNIPDPETETRLAEYPKDKQIILYCQ